MFELVLTSLRAVPSELRVKLIFLQFLLLFSSFVELLGVVSIGPFIALAVNPQYVHENSQLHNIYVVLGEPEESLFLIIAGATFSFLFVLSNGLLLLAQLKMIRLSNRLEAALSVGLFRYYLHRDYLFHVDNRSSALISKVGSDVSRFCNGLILSFLQINSRLFSIVVLLGLLLLVNSYAAILIGFLLAFIYVIVYAVVNQRLKVNGRVRTEVSRERTKILHESFDGVKCISFHNLHERYINRLKVMFERSVRLKVSDKLLKDLPFFVIESFAFLLVVVVVVVFFSGASSIESALAELAVICLAGYRLVPKFQQVYRALAKIKSNHTILGEIYADIMASQQDCSPAQITSDRFLRVEQGVFRLEGVSYSYNKEECLFSGVNFILSPGELIGIVGKSGSGKSTLMSLMIGLFRAESGSINYSGLSVSEAMLSDWRSVVGYVDSETYIFAGSFRENITLGDSVMDENHLNAVIELSCLDEVVRELEYGIDSNIGNKGSKLSSGQLQRLGFARALYRKPKLLFLDEATNALDFDTQQMLIARIRQNLPVLAIVVISHRLDIRENFDRCYLLESGVLAECL